MKYTFRNYNDNDYNLIYDLKKQAYQEYVKYFWGLWDDEKQHEFFNNYIKNQRDRIKIIVFDGKDVGYFDDKLCGNEYEIVNIIIKPEYQGKGVGTEILKNAIKEHLKNEIYIQCFKTNPVKNLYFKLGFEEIEQTNTHIKMELNKEKYLTYENDTKCSVKRRNKMKTLILSSSFTTYETDAQGNRKARIIDNDNGFLDNLKKCLTSRKCMVIITGNPNKKRYGDPNTITRQSFEMSGIPFDEYIYVDNSNKEHIAEYISRADCVNLLGGHLPTANKFINELNLKEFLKDYNGVIIGASGGAMNMAKKVYCIPEVEGEHKDKSFKRILNGLGLTNINIIPHYKLFEKKVFSDKIRMLEDILLPDSKKIPMIALPDRSYIIQQEDKIEIFGEAYLLENGKIKQINKNKLKGEKIMRLILNGGGSGEGVKESYELFAKEVNGGRVMYIPLAWNHGPCGECIHWFKSEMTPFGITDVDLITDAKQITKEKLKNVSGVFIGGGNTYKLLKYLKETPAFENLKEYIENGGLVMGSSAGALIWGRSIDSCKDDGLGIKSICDQNLVNLQDTTGFDMLNGYSLLVHYKKEEEQIPATEQRVKRLLKEGYKLICLPEETSLWINDKEAKIIGPKPAEIYDGHEKQTVHTNEDVLCR